MTTWRIVSGPPGTRTDPIWPQLAIPEDQNGCRRAGVLAPLLRQRRPPGREAEAAGLRVRVEARDLARGQDLAAPGVLSGIIKQAGEGKYDAAHSGFPCATFTQLRWRPAEGMPGPVRSRDHVYGLPGVNTRAQQTEADLGTLFASQSVSIMEAMERATDADGLARPATIENPPETLHPHACSVFCFRRYINGWTEKVLTWQTLTRATMRTPTSASSSSSSRSALSGSCQGFQSCQAFKAVRSLPMWARGCASKGARENYVWSLGGLP